MYIVFVDLSLDVIFGRPPSLLSKLWPLEFITYQRLMQIGINNLLWLSAQTLAQTSVIPQLYIHPSYSPAGRWWLPAFLRPRTSWNIKYPPHQPRTNSSAPPPTFSTSGTPQTYAEWLKVCVPPLSLTIFFDIPGLQSSEARIEALEAAETARQPLEAARQQISLDWETRTRIARGAPFPLYLGDHLITNQRTRAPFFLYWIHPKGSVFAPQSCGPWISYAYHFWDNKRPIDRDCCVKQCRPLYLRGRCTALKLTASHSLW